jgi:hypothetical protein
MFLVRATQIANEHATDSYYVTAYIDRKDALQHCVEANSEEMRLYTEVLGEECRSARNKWDHVHYTHFGIRVLYEVIEIPIYHDVNHYRVSN